MTGMRLFIYATTDNISWLLTRNPGDRGDCFRVEINPNNRDQYLRNGQPRDFKKIEEIIGVCHRILVLYKGEIIREFMAEETDKEEVMRYVLGGEGQVVEQAT